MSVHSSLCLMAQMVREREISPVDLVDQHLSQIDSQNPRLNAFVRVFHEQARSAAKQAERGIMRGESLGLLHGCPVTVKDSFDIAGEPTYCGSRFRLAHRAPSDSTAVRRFRNAGAIILGKTSTPEFLNYYETDNAITGRTNNPWNLDYTPGGSSGGESAALAAFCSAGGIGSDGGGSVRIPAHFSGIAALKPTPGRVSAAGHFPQIAHPGGLLGVAGPMARTAADVRLLFAVLSGHDIEDPFSVPLPLRSPDLDGVRVGVWPQFYDVPVEPVILDAVGRAAKALEYAGFPVDPFSPKGLERAPALWWFFFERVSSRFTKTLIEGREDLAHWTGTELLNRALAEPEPTGEEIVLNLAARDSLRTALLRQMERFSVLLLPPCCVTAFPHQTKRFPIGSRTLDLLEAMIPATLFNLLGFPAVVVPFGITGNGIPLGVQLVGRPYEEELLLEVAERLEQVRGPFASPPGY